MNNLNKMYNIPENIHVQLSHLHKGNSTDEQRNFHDYVTVVKFMEGEQVLTKAKAECSRHDAPSRKLGREIAIGRAKKQYFKK